MRTVNELVRRRVLIHGQVQGVFFRETTRRLAEDAGVAGWVRNLPDPIVEAAFEGPAHAVEQLIAFCRVGPPAAEVDRVEITDEAPTGRAGFAIRPTPPRDVAPADSQ